MPSSSSSSTRSSGERRCECPTSRSEPGRRPPSPPTAPRCSRSDGCDRRSTVRSRGVSSSASPRPAPTSPPSPRAPPGPRAAGCSTVRRCGPPSPRRPTGASAWRAPTRRPPSTWASPTSSWTCRRRASTSVRSRSSRAWRCSTRCSSTRCSCRTSAWWERSTEGGRWRAPPSPTSGCRWGVVHPSVAASRP